MKKKAGLCLLKAMNKRKHENNQLNIEASKVLEFQNYLLSWYFHNGRSFPWRKSNLSEYQLIITELLLQRTRAEVVSDYFQVFFKQYPSWIELADAPVSEIAKVVQPIGLWKRKSITLKRIAEEIVSREFRVPHLRQEIEALPGVGQYIANAILLLCYSQAQPLLDINMSRVLERVFGPRILSDIRYDPYLQALAMSVVQCKYPKEMNWAILDFAALICLIKKPLCNACILNKLCTFYGTQASNCNSDQLQ